MFAIAVVGHPCTWHVFMAMKILAVDVSSEVNAVDKSNETPLHLACSKSLDAVARMLVFNAHVEINMLNDRDKTPLHLACINSSVEIVRMLAVDAHAEVNMLHARDKTTCIWHVSTVLLR